MIAKYASYASYLRNAPQGPTGMQENGEGLRRAGKMIDRTQRLMDGLKRGLMERRRDELLDGWMTPDSIMETVERARPVFLASDSWPLALSILYGPTFDVRVLTV